MNTTTYTPAATPTKEDVYDAEINPLMAEIIAICQRAGIAMMASFAIPTPGDADLCSTSALPDETGAQPAHIAGALQRLMGHRSGPSVMLTTEAPDGAKTMTAILR